MSNLRSFLFISLLLGFFFQINAQNNTTLPIDKIENIDALEKTKSKKKKKILPIAVPITEPAVGYGLIGGALLFLPKKDSLQKSDIIAGTGGITTNGTWFAGGGYLGFWKDDKIRYTGFSGYGKITLNYYGFGSENPITFDQNVFIFMQQMLFGFGESDFYIGGKYQLSKITIPTRKNEEVVDFESDDLELWNSGIALIGEYDNLNNFLSPTKGVKFHLSYNQNLEFLGSQRDWGTLVFYTHVYIPISEKWIPAFRVETNLITGSPPFYAYPYVSLRGIPALRYQGKFAVVAETEQLYNISPRWGVVGFTGFGAAIDSVDEKIKNELVYNYGAGVRYLVLKDLGLKIGADLARGPEDWAFYMSVGSAW